MVSDARNKSTISFEDESLKLLSKKTEDKVNFILLQITEKNLTSTPIKWLQFHTFILFDMMQKMQNETGSFDYTKEGIALIDEVEAHCTFLFRKDIAIFNKGFFSECSIYSYYHSPFILQSLKILLSLI